MTMQPVDPAATGVHRIANGAFPLTRLNIANKLLAFGLVAGLTLSGAVHAVAASEDPDPQDKPDVTVAPAPTDLPKLEKKDKRILGFIPNYKTVPQARDDTPPLSIHGKFKLATDDSFDPFVLPIVGMYSAVSQFNNQNPSWGQGMKGYAKRYGAAFVDSTTGNYMTEAIFPTLLHQDPRYFRLGEGGALKRTSYALTRVLVTRTDGGHNNVNISEVVGNFTAGAISNFYQPPEGRNVWATVRRGTQQTMYDSIFNILKEYWPDIHKKLFKK